MNTRLSVMFAVLFLYSCIAPLRGEDQQYTIEYVSAETLPQCIFNGEASRIHCQGLFVTDKHFLITGRLERKPKRGLLIRFDRNTRSYETLDITQAIGDMRLDHPGGFDRARDGCYWIPVSTSHPRGPTRICSIRIDDSKPLSDARVDRKFEAKDHIGAIACLDDGTLIAANWDTKLISYFSLLGDKISEVSQKSCLLKSDPHVAIQDWKSFPVGRGSKVIIGGLDKSADRKNRAVVLIADMRLGGKPELHRLPPAPGSSTPVTNEGLHLFKDSLYLLPQDLNAGAKVLRYRIRRTDTAEGKSTR